MASVVTPGLSRFGGRLPSRNADSQYRTHVLPRAPWEMHAELRAAQMVRNDTHTSGS